MDFFQYYQRGGNTSTPQRQEKDIFFEAIRNGDVDKVTDMVNNKVGDKNRPIHKDDMDKYGNTAGILAINGYMETHPPECNKYKQILHVLGDAGFDFAKPNKGGWTMLYICYQHREAIEQEVIDYIKCVLGRVPITYC